MSAAPKENLRPVHMDREKIETGVRLILEGLGVCPDDSNFKRTPHRVAKVYEELFQPPKTEWPVFDEDYTDMVIMRGHTFWSLCPHHLLPVRLVASVGYIPCGKVLGASKLIRMIHDCIRAPMTQEALTAGVIAHIRDLTGGTSEGEAVFMEGRHGCFEIRGVRSDACLITCKFNGRFETDAELQRRFMDLVRAGGNSR
jgi:GTP cyclohydrolase I